MHFVFSIDGHPLKVISTDFVPIEPYVTNSVSIGIGMCQKDLYIQLSLLLIINRSTILCHYRNKPDARQLLDPHQPGRRLQRDQF